MTSAASPARANFAAASHPPEPSKVPAVTLGFWIIKILATTLGETGGDAATMSLNLGYAFGSLIFTALFVGLVALQIRAQRFRPYLYWLTMIATTMLGTTVADFSDRSLGIGYAGGSAILLALLVTTLAVWRRTEGTIAVTSVVRPRVEAFYWVAILFSQTLGTALGDWMADTNGLGYAGGAVVFLAGLALVAGAYLFTNVSRVALFWLAFILTRPLGATVGDLIDKPHTMGGFAIDRFTASGILVAAVLALIFVTRPEAGRHTGRG
jgi:uncharacterized membrane-anchored protein